MAAEGENRSAPPELPQEELAEKSYKTINNLKDRLSNIPEVAAATLRTYFSRGTYSHRDDEKRLPINYGVGFNIGQDYSMSSSEYEFSLRKGIGWDPNKDGVTSKLSLIRYISKNVWWSLNLSCSFEETKGDKTVRPYYGSILLEKWSSGNVVKKMEDSTEAYDAIPKTFPELYPSPPKPFF